jgi:hypothetical protein
MGAKLDFYRTRTGLDVDCLGWLSDIAVRRVVLNDSESFDRNLSWLQIIGLSMPPPMTYASHEDD